MTIEEKTRTRTGEAPEMAPKEPSKTGRQRKRDPERTAAAILEAGIAEFSQHGYDGARVDGIARRAHVNKRMLYHYYGGKDGLYVAVLEGRYAAIRAAERELDLSRREPIEAMRQLVLFTWNYYIEHPEFLAILAVENQHKARFLTRSDHIVEMNSPLIEAIAEVLRRGEAEGVFRAGVDPVELYISMASLGAFYLSNRWTLSAIFSRELTSKPALQEWGEHIVEMVLAFVGPQGGIHNARVA